MEYLEHLLRWAFGVQMLFWGINGFTHWVRIPPSPPAIDRFVKSCIETKFIMPTVKLAEIAGGFALLLNFQTPWVLIGFFPIMFVISGLHAVHNKKPWGVLLPCTVPYVLLLLLRLPIRV